MSAQQFKVKLGMIMEWEFMMTKNELAIRNWFPNFAALRKSILKLLF